MSSYVPNFQPYEQQRLALEKMNGREFFALFMAMRTGKSYVTLADFGRLASSGVVRNMLIIAPGGAYRIWETEIKTHVPQSFLKNTRTHFWKSAASRKERLAREAFMDTPHEGFAILSINVEALSSVQEAREFVLEFLQRGKTYVVIDESVIIANKSKRTDFILKKIAPLADYRRILSGLPTPKNPLDIYRQMFFLDWRILGFTSYFAFRARYAQMHEEYYGGRRVPVVDGYRNVSEIHDKIAPHTFRCRLEDCFDLPPKIYVPRHIELTSEQKRLYQEMKEFATMKLAEEVHVTATVVIAQIARLHQLLCGHTVDENGQFHEIPENRTKELLSLLDDIEETEKVIIWCTYDNDIGKVTKALCTKYGESSVARFWGGNAKTREDEERAFKEEPNRRFMVATQAAGARGRNWSIANTVVYYSNSDNLDHRDQSEERPRSNKKNSILYVDLCVPGTVDEKIIHSLRNKINMASIITGDNYREWLI